MKNVQALCGLLILALLNGCGGGGAGGSGVPAAPQTMSKAAFTISIPLRSPQYLSANMQSFGVTLNSVNGAAPSPAVAPLVVNTTPSGPNCTTSGSTLTCTAEFDVPIGNDQFTMTSYAGINGTGAVLSTGAITQAINPGVANTVPLALGGVVDSIVVAVANTTPASGTAASIPVTVTAKDASGATIVGAANYSQPITLSTSDAANAALSASTVTSPATAVNVNYNGAAVGAITISATASGVASAKITNAVMTPSGANIFSYAGMSFNSADFFRATINHGNNTFSGTESKNGYTYNGTYSVLPNGFLKVTITSTTDPHPSSSNSVVYVREVAGVGALVEPTGTNSPMASGGATGGNVLFLPALTACPASGAYTGLNVVVPSQNFNLASSDAYGWTNVNFAGANYTASGGTKYLLNGTPSGSPSSGSGACSGGILTDVGGSIANFNTLGLFASSDIGAAPGNSQTGSVGIVQPASNLNLLTLGSQTYFGFVYSIDNTGLQFETPIVSTPQGGGVELACTYANFEGNTLSPAAQCATITFSGQSAPGIIQVTQTQGGSTVSATVVANQAAGKYMLFGIAPPFGASPGPGQVNNIILFQQ